jgi:hypothetical protein
MAARAHGWAPKNPQHKLPPVSVAKEFNAADQGVRHAFKRAAVLHRK